MSLCCGCVVDAMRHKMSLRRHLHANHFQKQAGCSLPVCEHIWTGVEVFAGMKLFELAKVSGALAASGFIAPT